VRPFAGLFDTVSSPDAVQSWTVWSDATPVL